MWLLCSFFGYCKHHDSYGNLIVKQVCEQSGYHEYCWDSAHWDKTLQDYESFWRDVDFKRTGGLGYDAIVHLRCGDVPFMPFDIYQMACPQDIIPYVNIYAEVHVMVGGHGGNEHKCDVLFHRYIDILRALAPHTKFIPLHRANIDVDFKRLHEAQHVISIVASSFVFVSRLGNLDHYKSPNFGIPNASWTYDATACDEKLRPETL